MAEFTKEHIDIVNKLIQNAFEDDQADTEYWFQDAEVLFKIHEHFGIYISVESNIFKLEYDGIEASADTVRSAALTWLYSIRKAFKDTVTGEQLIGRPVIMVSNGTTAICVDYNEGVYTLECCQRYGEECLSRYTYNGECIYATDYNYDYDDGTNVECLGTLDDVTRIKVES